MMKSRVLSIILIALLAPIGTWAQSVDPVPSDSISEVIGDSINQQLLEHLQRRVFLMDSVRKADSLQKVELELQLQ